MKKVIDNFDNKGHTQPMAFPISPLVTIIYAIVMGILIGALAYVSVENKELKRQLKDVQSTVKMLDEELQEVHKIN